jgi:MFS family permease
MAGILRRFRSHDLSGASSVPKASPAAITGRDILIPLAAAQFLASYDTQSMNVAIGAIVEDLDTTVTGVQSAISLFTLTMAALMIPGSKLTDIWGRKRCFTIGLTLYGAGALLTALAPALSVMVLGYSLLEGIGSALMIPPIYILITVLVTDVARRTKAFAVVSAAAGLGAALGPLLGGFITTAISWRASFLFEVVAILVVIYMARKIPESGAEGPKPRFDLLGAVLSALALLFIVLGLLQAGSYGWLRARKDFVIGDTTILNQGDISPVILFFAIGFGLLVLFVLHIFREERHGREPLLPTRLFRSSVTNLGLITQNSQWFIMIGSSFVISVFFQVSLGYNAIETGLALTPATIGILLASFRMGRIASKYSKRTIVRAGFIFTLAGIALVLLLGSSTASVLAFAPGLFLIGFGCGLMLTASVDVVQGSVPEADQGSLSGLSRSVSNLGSSLGVALAGAVLISALISGVSSLTDDSQVLAESDKQAISTALQGDVSALSDAQVEAQLEGHPQEVVDEVVRINAEARDRALGLALISIALVGLIGVIAAFLLPAGAGESKPSQASAT